MDILIKLVGITGFVSMLIVMESLQDVYMQSGLSPEWRQKMKDGVKAMCNISLTDEHMDIFIESLVDNSFQKLDLVKTLLWANIGLLLINGLEDSLQEKLGIIKNGILNKLSNFKLPSKFSKVGGTAGVIRDLVVRKDEKVKKLSDYMYQATSTGSSLLNSTNTGSLSKMYQKNNLGKLSPKEQASYQVVKEMLNTVQASR